MTEKEFLALAPREQDAVVAEKVMGERSTWRDAFADLADRKGLDPDETVWVYAEDVHGEDHLVFDQEPRRYTTDISAAWEVLEKMGPPVAMGWDTDGVDDEAAWCHFVARSDAIAPTAPLAICIAALKAVGEIQ